jgi:hypothetical protein
MPRAVENNPTERIQRLIVEMGELVAIVQSEAPALLPRLPNYESERVRQTLTYRRNVNRTRPAGTATDLIMRECLEQIGASYGPGPEANLFEKIKPPNG